MRNCRTGRGGCEDIATWVGSTIEKGRPTSQAPGPQEIWGSNVSWRFKLNLWTQFAKLGAGPRTFVPVREFNLGVPTEMIHSPNALKKISKISLKSLRGSKKL
jgi:hypothetical protein